MVGAAVLREVDLQEQGWEPRLLETRGYTGQAKEKVEQSGHEIVASCVFIYFFRLL